MKAKRAAYESEAAMCADFIAYAEGRGYVAYAETGGFDILLSRKSDGFQIGVQAKLRLNVDVIRQSLEGCYCAWEGVGPDCRAVLVPSIGTGRLDALAPYLGLTVIVARGPGEMHGEAIQPIGEGYLVNPYHPPLPIEGKFGEDAIGETWYDLCSAKRVRLPDYIPDVLAGASAPVQLTQWKIRALRIAVLLETRGWVTRGDFKHLQIDVRRWLSMGWLAPQDGVLKPAAMPDFRAQHPRVFDEVAADIERWKPPSTNPMFAQGGEPTPLNAGRDLFGDDHG